MKDLKELGGLGGGLEVEGLRFRIFRVRVYRVSDFRGLGLEGVTAPR